VPKILVIEDDRDLAVTIVDALQGERHIVDAVHDGIEGLERLRLETFDVIILDWQLPRKSGIEILREARAEGLETPVIMLTGRGTIDNKEEGLGRGADDYLTKPFDIRELLARIRAQVRRSGRRNSVETTLQVRDLQLDPVKYKLTKGEKELHLMPKDFALLEFFMRHPDQVFSVPTILARVWSNDSEASPEGLRVAIRRIRKTIDSSDDPSESIIENVARVGYRLRSS
jgi:DNA-binding response OmpR family regulator